MINYNDCNIDHVSVHHVGNRIIGEDILLSKSSLDTSDILLRELLLRFFLQNFVNPEFNSFTFSDGDFTLNPLFVLCNNIFEKKRKFHSNSISIAKYLYEISAHPNIKAGDLFTVYFSNIILEDEMVDAIGIFKSESKQPFLKLDISNDTFILECEKGINIEKLDKGCLIFNTNGNEGYKICAIDKSNKSTEAQFWINSFLNVRALNDDVHQTKNFLALTKNFVTKQLNEEYEISNTDKAEYLKRSVEYFKTNEQFDEGTFSKQVFGEANVIKSFKRFKEDYVQRHDLDISNGFAIAPVVVQKQARAFKSILKLDKNFDIYIHGNTDLIQHGIEKDGRKYYKIYYEQEK